jgi:DNA-binding response OmpR family regulator
MTKILIVDDEEIARLTLAEILHLEGYEITTVSSGEEAVKALRREPFEVMILDLKMAGMSGMDVMKEVVDTNPDLEIIVLTAYGTIDSAIQAIRYRVHDYLLKPVSPEQVVETIGQALAKKRTPAQEFVGGLQAAEKNRVEALPGGAALAWDRRTITWQVGSLTLTPTEAKLMKILFDRRNEVVPHSELVYLIQGYRIETEEAAKILRPVISRLREKLASVPAWDDRIKNIRGVGYVLDLDDQG